jgi:hypothetical protein
MKKIVSAALFFACMAGFVISASALPPIPAYVEEHYSASPEHAKYLAMYRSLDMEHKCDACHKPDQDKKAKGHALNDYGQAVAKNFKHRDFNKADKLGKTNGEEAAKAKKLIADALDKADGEKNAAGQTFGELIKAGKLPGTN